jgi:uncharacterized protein (DUF2235 family)
MGRKIVLLSDGTGNSSAKVWRTNVWRIFERLDLSNSDVVAYYDDGVGTSGFKPLAILGGAFGYGLKRNVIDLYKFVCRNYRNDDDEIFEFGFSRGAFTIRILTALVLEQGLVRARSEKELHAKAKAAYRQFRRDNFHTSWPKYMRPEFYARKLRDIFLGKKYSKDDNRSDVNVRFLGLWDSVAAYGLPIEEMTQGFGKWIWPWQIPDCRLNDKVKRACHALSIDDERTTFHPVLWDERNEAPLAPRADGSRVLADERISQVWFAGVHSNVGGGYPDDSLAQIPLVWIMSEAEKCGLRFKADVNANPQTVGHAKTAQDKDGRIYDPRSGLGSYYRYGPRDLPALTNELLARKLPSGNSAEVLPRIHESVLERVGNYAHSYAPNGLPARYEIATYDGKVLPPEQQKFETSQQAQARVHLQDRVWNTIWWRRIAYFMTLGVTLYLLAFPLMEALPAEAEFESPFRWVSDIVRLVGAFLPGVADPWINGYARDPSWFLIVVIVLVGMTLWGSSLASRIHDRMAVNWRDALTSRLVDPGPAGDPVYLLRTNKIYKWVHRTLKNHIAPFFFALVFAWLALTFTSHVLYNLQDFGGWVCQELETPLSGLGSGDIVLANGRTANLQGIADGMPSFSESGKKDPLKHAFAIVPNLPVFETRNLCQSMKVRVERNATYLIRFESTRLFSDGGIEASNGFNSWSAPTWWQKGLMLIAVPLRRELIRPWFRVVARFGATGGEETFLDPDTSAPRYRISENVKATRDGELFLFVNDAVLAIPGLYDFFYWQNNKGSTRVLIMRK